MFQTIEVHSRTDMENMTRGNLPECAIVSISDYNQNVPDFADNPNIAGICTVFFDDEETGATAMTHTDAHEILSFVRQMSDQGIETLYVHCGAGVSRSAGTAAALMMLWWGDDRLVFDDGRYSPNMHCYRTMLDAAGFGYSNDEVTEKEARQYELWKILHAGDLR